MVQTLYDKLQRCAVVVLTNRNIHCQSHRIQ